MEMTRQVIRDKSKYDIRTDHFAKTAEHEMT